MTMNKKYDLFCSYSHVDNDSRWVDELVENLSSLFQKLTGNSLEIFMDKSSIITSELWEDKIKSSLEVSKLFLAVLSPSYFKSKWCIYEWDFISNVEKQLRKSGKIPDQFGLIVPILLYPLDRGRFTDSENKCIEDAKRRQWQDFSSSVINTPLRPTQIRNLVENIIDLLYEIDFVDNLNEIDRAENSKDSSSLGTLIIDPTNNLMWSGLLSREQLSFEDAKSYSKTFDLNGYDDWRLPSKEELETIIDPKLLSKDPNSSPVPLFEPFNSRRWGYLHSGTLIKQNRKNNGNYIMNLRNGHIFNGVGYEAFVRMVRTQESTLTK